MKEQSSDNVLKMKCKTQLAKLLKVPKIQQKTTEWYNARNNLITASDFAQALGEGKFGTQKQLIEKKVEAVLSPDTGPPPKNPFFEWGNMFEPVACNVYSAMHNDIIIHEFGLIQHPTRPYFGASPDGITEDGVMLEIKCPFKRKIGGEIPMQYYYQIQGQLDVCGLQECDYFECEFSKYETHDAYMDAIQNMKDAYSGVIIKTKDGYEYPTFKYGAPCDDHGSKVYYWILTKYNKQRVEHDKKFVEEKLDLLKEVWDKIAYYRKNPEVFALQVKKTLHIDTESSVPPAISEKNKCMIIDLD